MKDNGMTDRELLAQYVGTGSQDAFEEIVRRHSGLVYSVCLRILNDPHAAEDSAQAAFIVLMRRRATISSGTTLSGWLFQTAELTARNARKMRARRRKHERNAAAIMESRTIENPSAAWDALAPHIDAALAELPVSQRDAVVFRYLRGLSQADAARELGCTEETLHSRVNLGLAKLRAKLRRRGVAMTTAMLSGLFREHGCPEAPEHVINSISKIGFKKAVVSASVLEIANGVIQSLVWATVKWWSVFALLVAVCLLPTLQLMLNFKTVTHPMGAKEIAHQPIESIMAKGMGVSPTPITNNRLNNMDQTINGEKDNDGRHLNDPKLWQVFGELPVHAAATKCEIDMSNPDNEKWRMGGILYKQEINPEKGNFFIRMAVTCSNPPDQQFFIHIGANADPAAIEIDKQILNILHKEADRGSFSKPPEETMAKRFEKHIYEIFISKNESEKRVDGARFKIVSKDQQRMLAFCFGSKGPREGVRFVIEDVSAGYVDVGISKDKLFQVFNKPEVALPTFGQAADQDGMHLDNLDKWCAFGALPKQVAARRVDLDLKNPDKVWSVGGLLFRQGLKPGNRVIYIRATVTYAKSAANSCLNIYAHPFLEDPLEDHVDEQLQFETALKRISQDPVPDSGSDSPPPTPFPGERTFEETEYRRLKYELFISNKKILRYVDGVCRYSSLQPSKVVYIGFKASSRELLENASLAVEDVFVGYSDKVMPVEGDIQPQNPSDQPDF